jgi:predicted Zn-dependent protease
MRADDFQIHDDLQFTDPIARQFGACADCAAGRCAPPQRGRRLFTGLLAATGAAAFVPAWAREGVDVGPKSKFTGFVSAEQLERDGGQQYAQMMQQAAQKRALAPLQNPQLQRLRYIAQRIIPFSYEWNDRARQWKWEVNLLGDQQLNAFCIPGGKIAFFYGILEKLKLEDDEVAAIMGHEVAHALREHARERVGKSTLTNLGAEALSANKGAPPQWLSTHPANATRIRDIQANLPKVEGLYQRAPKPDQRFPVAPPLKPRAD